MNIDRHPCFNKEASAKYARIHLPVAPECNIQCKYCSRKYDCVNESRPGVTSAVLTPEEAFDYLRRAREKAPNLSVVGIAGPGDPFANADKTIKTLELAHAEFPDLIFCLSTNGLELYDNIPRLKELNVSHVTITINAIKPEIGAKIYAWVRHKKHIYRGEEGAGLLIKEQLRCVKALKEAGIIVKINSILIPGVNDTHIEAVAAKVKSLGADIMNCIPLLLAPGSEYAEEEQAVPDHELLDKVRAGVRKELPVMEHCRRCRADAAGLLGHDNPELLNELKRTVEERSWLKPDRPMVAIASYEGLLVNRHLGDADFFYVFERGDGKFISRGKRPAPQPGGGDERWRQLADALRDCSVVLVADAGARPFEVLSESGIKVFRCSGLIDQLLRDIYEGNPLKTVASARLSHCRRSCGGGNAVGGCC